MDEETLRGPAGIEHADRRLDPETDSPSVRHTERVNPERRAAHEESVEPRRATAPDHIPPHEHPDGVEGVDGDIAADRIESVDREDESPKAADEPSGQEERR